MRKITLAAFMLILLPATGFSQQPLVLAVCSKVNPSIRASLDLQVVESKNLSEKLKEEFSKSPQVVVCLENVTKSTGHGLLPWLGFVKWDKRQVAEIKLLKVNKNKYTVTGIVGFTELKAPLGKWHLKKAVHKSWDPKTIMDSKKGLSDIAKKLLGKNSDQVTVSFAPLKKNGF